MPKLLCRFTDQPTHRTPRPSPTYRLQGWALSVRDRVSTAGEGESDRCAWSVGFVHGFIQAVGLGAYASGGACVAEAEEEVRQLWSVLRAVSVPHEPTGA